MTKPVVVVCMPVLEPLLTALATHFEVRYWPDCPDGEPPQLDDVRGLVVSGMRSPAVPLLTRMPRLAIVAHTGAGYEGIDLPYARANGIVVTHNPGANSDTVADHALGMMLAIARGFARVDASVRAGQWHSLRRDPPTINGMRLGLVGLGNIGMKIAQRAAAFNMDIGYHSRRARTDVPWQHHASLVELARTSDYLVLAAPGGAATRHIVNTEVLDALGAEGFLVNVARGSIVDTEALIEALRERRIAGAALDVFEAEPAVPPDLLELDNVLLSPHLAGRAPNSMREQYRQTIANLVGQLLGTGAITPIPTSR